MVLAIRRGSSFRRVARRFGVAVGTVQLWVARARGLRLDRVDFSDHPPGARRAVNRTSSDLEPLILRIRKDLQEHSVLGEHGDQAIRRVLLEQSVKDCPAARTIGRILERHGLLDGRLRVRRPPPAKGWFLPDVAARQAELDSFDMVTDLIIEGGTPVTVLNAMSLHGGLAASWPDTRITARIVVPALLEHWRSVGLPHYAKFDNDLVFQGAHQWADSFGRVVRVCLQLGVVPVFTPVRETGFQAELEAFNGRWQRLVWRRHHHADLPQLRQRSAAFIEALRTRLASRIEAAPPRRAMPEEFKVDYRRALDGRLIFIRRTNDRGAVQCLGHQWMADEHWVRRLTRIEVDLDAGKVSIYALRRREPTVQPLLTTFPYTPPKKTFREKSRTIASA